MAVILGRKPGGSGGGGGSQTVLSVARDVTPAEVQAIGVTAIELLPAVANKFYIVLGGWLYYTFGTVAYVNPGAMFVRYSNATICKTQDGILEATESFVCPLSPPGFTLDGGSSVLSYPVDATNVVNNQVELWIEDGNPADGDGALTVKLYYTLEDVPT